jgi:hypothetical protein
MAKIDADDKHSEKWGNERAGTGIGEPPEHVTFSPNRPIPKTSNDRFAMDEPRLSEVLDAVQGARSAFQKLCGEHPSLRVQADSRDLLALDASFQALGNIVQTLEGVVSGGTQIQLVDSILTTSIPIPASGNHVSFADAIIGDMHTLQARLNDVRSNISPLNIQSSTTLMQLLPLGEAMSTRAMIEKYRSIINDACSSQIMCVILS